MPPNRKQTGFFFFNPVWLGLTEEQTERGEEG